MATLAIYRGDRLHRRVELGEQPIRIGRAPENELVLDDANKGVSRAHAEIRLEEGGHVITDLNSQNGLWVGDRRVQRETLTLDVPVRIGPYSVILESGAAAAAAVEPEAPVPVAVDADIVEPAEPTIVPMVPRPPQPSPTPPPRPAATPPPQPRPAATPLPQPPSRRQLPVGGLIAAGVIVTALGAWAVITLSSRGEAPPAGPEQRPPSTTTSVSAEQAAAADAREKEQRAQQEFEGHLNKAREFFDKKEKATAGAEIEAALTLRPENAGARELREQIDQLPGTPADAAAGSEANPVASSTNEEAEGQKAVAPPKTPQVVSTLTVANKKGRETLREKRERQRRAEAALVAGVKQAEEGDYAAAIRSLEQAIDESGRRDFGRTANEAQSYIEKAQAALDAAARAQATKRIQELVAKATALASSDVLEAWKVADQIRSLDSEAAGLAELIRDLVARSQKQGEAAFDTAMNLDAYRSPNAAAQYERAIRLLERVPGGHKNLQPARDGLTRLRAPK